MRRLTITRERKMNGGAVPFFICIDGKVIGEVANGETKSFNIDSNQHNISVFADMLDGRHTSCVYKIRSSNNECKYRIYRKIRLIAKDDMYLEEI